MEQNFETPQTSQHTTKRRPRLISKKFVALALVILVIFLGIVGLKIINHPKKSSPNLSNASTSAPTPTPPVDLASSGQTKNYENGPLGITFDYQSNWTVTETDDSGIRLESPSFKYTDINGKPTNGNFRIYIRKGARPSDSKYIGRGVALDDSTKVVYAKPAPGQRTDTLVTNFGLDDTTNFAYFFVAGNFQLKTGDTLGPNYGKEKETYIIAGGYSTPDLKDDMSMSQLPSSYIKTSSAYKLGLDVVKSLQLR
jgi:hypothetical protein